jgi:phosphohistidine phosphatase
MLLYVMRHGPAEDRAPSGRDFDRGLTAAGREVVALVAAALHEARRPLAGRPWRLLTSPFRRALETAEIVATAASPRLDVEVHEDLAAGAGVPLALVEELAEADTDVLLVGHQPTVEELTRELLHPARLPPGAGFRTASVVILERATLGGWRAGDVLDPHLPRERGPGENPGKS